MPTMIATGLITHPETLAPEERMSENAVLLELTARKLVDAAYLHAGDGAITIVLTADSVATAEEGLAALPLVRSGRLVLEVVAVRDLLDANPVR